MKKKPIVDIAIVRPTTDGWTGSRLLKDILDMALAAQHRKECGPYFLMLARNWLGYINKPYTIEMKDGQVSASPTKSLYDVILELDFIQGLLTTEVLENYDTMLFSLSVRGES